MNRWFAAILAGESVSRTQMAAEFGKSGQVITAHIQTGSARAYKALCADNSLCRKLGHLGIWAGDDFDQSPAREVFESFGYVKARGGLDRV